MFMHHGDRRMGRKSVRQSGKSKSRPKPKRRAPAIADQPAKGWDWSTYVLGVLAVLIFGALVVLAVGRWDNPPAYTDTQYQAPQVKAPEAEVRLASHIYRTDGPRNLGELLELPGQEIDQLDIALINLLCAEGLPGSEDIDIEGTLATLDAWTVYAKRETDRHIYKFYQDPAAFDHSEGRWRMAMLISTLQQDCGVHYNMERVREVDFTHSEDLFIHGMVRPGMTPVLAIDDPAGAQALLEATNGGTCISMPVVYTAIARRLGYPVTLSSTQAHVFCRWDGRRHRNPMYRDYFNLEGTGRGYDIKDDAYYLNFPKQITPEFAERHGFLKSQTNREAMAGFLSARGHCLLDTGRAEEAFYAYRHAVRYEPDQPYYRDFMMDAQARALGPDHTRSASAARTGTAGARSNSGGGGGMEHWERVQRQNQRFERMNTENQRRLDEQWRRVDQQNPRQTYQPNDPYAPPTQGF